MNLFNAYRKMFASLDASETVIWWYCGTVTTVREGVGEIPHTQAETIMAYRSRDLGPDSFAIDWNEIGCFRDITSGEIMNGWFNPFLGAKEPYPRSFVDGPATFTLNRTAGDGVQIDLVQNNARIDGVKLDAAINPRSIGLVQTEIKTRTFHRPDGSLPALDSPDATAIETVLSIWSNPAAVADPAQRNVASHGFYKSGSRGTGGAGGGGSWASTTVRGTMQKARDDERVNAIAWARLQKLYPAFFKADRIAPAWS